jgi:UDP-N-acetylglucosamine 2-epimerase (non-hydrolysing)/GDP/UDP-N,N'-diacetylbacillosamine 2-epimerase (hydrolysing)
VPAKQRRLGAGEARVMTAPTQRICAVSGSRADFGLLFWPLKELGEEPAFSVDIALTGMHLAPEFGATSREVEAAGIPVSARIETVMASDGPAGMAKAIGLGVLGFADAWGQRRPDLIMVLGDRFETFAAAQAAFTHRIPIAHLCGGDVTEGALDDGFRHAISKMASLHFASNDAAARRLHRMGEDPARIHTVGSPGLDHLKRSTLLDLPEVERRLGFSLRARNLLVTFHPATLDPVPAGVQQEELLAALDSLGPDTGILFTAPNADEGGRGLRARLEKFVAERPNAILRASLGHHLYLSTMALVDAVIGNSSSGLYEAPSLRRPTVNIGCRQDGRLRAASIVDCPAERQAIGEAIASAFDLDCSNVVNPYGDGETAPRIREILRRQDAFASLVTKRFHDA